MSDPEAMRQLENMARQLGLISTNEAPKEETREPEIPEELAGFLAAMGKSSASCPEAELLSALRPILRPDKQYKADRAIRVIRLINTAKAAAQLRWASEDSYV